ncbi:MAG: translocator protein [Clostridiales bacterium]|nr:translocator protein [Clostridiales bacterium]
MKTNWKLLFENLAISLMVGGLAGIISNNARQVYDQIAKPAGSPPAWVFPVVWTVLYVFMGVGAYLISKSNHPGKENALWIYRVQLFLTLIWPIFFFNQGNYQKAFYLLCVLWISILIMIISFFKISKCAALLQLPYLLWVTYAGYLNYQIVRLSA